MLRYPDTPHREDGIVIIGLGGAGAHILQQFSGSSAENVRMCIISPDERLGRERGNVEFLQLGAAFNHGLGCGGDPEVGRMALEESRAAISELLAEARLLVMVVGLGGGTGSGVAPLLAEMAAEAGVFLVSVVIMPFAGEGRRRRAQAEQALDAVSAHSDIVCCFENDYMEELFNSKDSLQSVYDAANALIAQLTAAIPMMATAPGLLNIGLDELIAALRNNDARCIFGSGSGTGPRRAEEAARAALESPLPAYHQSLRFAHTVIVHIAGGSTMSLAELHTVMDVIRAGLPQGEDAVQLFFGAGVKKRLGDEIRVSLLAGIDAGEFRAAVEAEKAAAACPPPAVEEEDSPEENAEPEEDADSSEAAAEDSAEDDIFGSEPPEEPLPVVPEPEPRAPEAPAPAAPALPPSPRRSTPQQAVFRLDDDSFTPDDDLARFAPASQTGTLPVPPRRHGARDTVDWDTPPALRNNDLRDIFPE